MFPAKIHHRKQVFFSLIHVSELFFLNLGRQTEELQVTTSYFCFSSYKDAFHTDNIFVRLPI